MKNTLLAVLAAVATLHVASALAAPPPDSPAGRIAADEALYPPWQQGANNGAAEHGFEFTVPPVDNLADFHGSLDHPALVLYIAGNDYFAIGATVRAFEKAYPRYRGVYFETLPPGLLRKQLEAGGRITVGNMTWTAKPDVFMAGLGADKALVKAGRLVEPVVAYASNDLAIMIPKGNPGHVTGLADLGRADLPLAMPNPEFEGVSRQIKASLAAAGGEALVKSVYEDKVASGMTVLTHIHHRQTPLWLMQGRVQAGVTWTSEAVFQEKSGHPIEHVAIPADQNTRAIYSAAIVKGAAHAAAARAWLQFVASRDAVAILQQYGFQPYHAK
jgi:ABC-type molybdate transport system substrate-binding protein